MWLLSPTLTNRVGVVLLGEQVLKEKSRASLHSNGGDQAVKSETLNAEFSLFCWWRERIKPAAAF